MSAPDGVNGVRYTAVPTVSDDLAERIAQGRDRFCELPERVPADELVEVAPVRAPSELEPTDVAREWATRYGAG